MSQKYRLITRSDLDGIACAALLKEIGMVDEIKFAHPKDVQDGLIDIGPNDIITDLPYHSRAYMVFDHHVSELERARILPKNVVNDPSAPSAAYVIYRHFGGASRFPYISSELLEETDKVDSARLTIDEILNPDGWVMLGFIMDNRTGLGRFRQFRISNYQLMLELVDVLRRYRDPQDILKLPDVAERVELYHEHAKLARQQIMKCSEVFGSLVVIDYRNEPEIFTTNRFTVYAMYPNCNISMHIMPGKQGANTVISLGKSILDRSCPIDIGKLMVEYGGGGHKAVGSCQIDNADADAVKTALMAFVQRENQPDRSSTEA